jgi:hypothetical protein
MVRLENKAKPRALKHEGWMNFAVVNIKFSSPLARMLSFKRDAYCCPEMRDSGVFKLEYVMPDFSNTASASTPYVLRV